MSCQPGCSVCERLRAAALALVGGKDSHEMIGILDRERMQEDGIRHSKDRGVRPYSQGVSEDGNESKST